MKFKITLNGVTVEREIPNAWHLVTFDQFVKLAKAQDNMAEIISVFTGIDPEVVAKAEIKNFSVLMSCLSFMQTEMNLLMPSEINGMKVPKDIESEAIARYADIQEIVKKFNPDDKSANLEHYPAIVGTYLAPSPYDYKQAEEIAKTLLNAPCQEVVAIANFTLLKLIASRSGMLNSSHLEGTLRNRLKRVIRLWLNRLAFTIRYNTWRRLLPSRVKTF